MYLQLLLQPELELTEYFRIRHGDQLRHHIGSPLQNLELTFIRNVLTRSWSLLKRLLVGILSYYILM